MDGTWIEIRVGGCLNKTQALKLLERLTLDDAGDRWVKTKPVWFEEAGVLEVTLEQKRPVKSDVPPTSYDFFSI